VTLCDTCWHYAVEQGYYETPYKIDPVKLVRLPRRKQKLYMPGSRLEEAARQRWLTPAAITFYFGDGENGRTRWQRMRKRNEHWAEVIEPLLDRLAAQETWLKEWRRIVEVAGLPGGKL